MVHFEASVVTIEISLQIHILSLIPKMSLGLGPLQCWLVHVLVSNHRPSLSRGSETLWDSDPFNRTSKLSSLTLL